jgi:SagB-type dehydrogenase family enzyme
MERGIGDRFQQETKYARGRLPGGELRWDLKPETYKTYPGAPRIELPPPTAPERDTALWQVLKTRHSVRSFAAKPLACQDLSRLLWASQGITRVNRGSEFRSAPSAGALYPVETYLAVHDVESIPSGLYHYAVKTHELEQLNAGDFRLQAAQAALDQDMAYSANAVFFWTAVFERAKWKYRQRAYRYVYLDAGHLAQNLALAAEGLRLGSCQIAALYDDEANGLLELDGISESVLYMSVVGHPLT